MTKNNFILKIWAGLLFFGLNSNLAFANWPDQGTMYGGSHMMGNGMGWIMFLFWGLVLGILILVIRWVANLSRENRFSGKQKNAMEILKERFAKGEIDIAEFESKKRIIAE